MKSGEKLQHFTLLSIFYTCYANKMVVNKNSFFVFQMIEVTQYNYSTKLLHRSTSRNLYKITVIIVEKNHISQLEGFKN